MLEENTLGLSKLPKTQQFIKNPALEHRQNSYNPLEAILINHVNRHLQSNSLPWVRLTECFLI